MNAQATRPAIVLERIVPGKNMWNEPERCWAGVEPERYFASFLIHCPLQNSHPFDVICSPEELIDGHYLVWQGEPCSVSGGFVRKKVVGVICSNGLELTELRPKVEQKTYELAKTFAQERAKKESYGWYNDKVGMPVIDKISRARESPLVNS